MDSYVCDEGGHASDTSLSTTNNSEGLTAADDHLPKRFTSEALPETKKSITPEQMAILLREYYAARNWDENGLPKSED
ncbi:MAG: hypothetical protein JRF71_08800 [Deltaproteobacteria bacterium]|nr:hypothetical protein [Deltaproteobacteria bacterium]